MEHEDKDIDVSVLEALIDLRKQQELVDQYCQKAEELKAKVEDAVYQRVTSDYAKRRTALEQEAAPLVTRALGEYRKLRATYERVQRTHDAAKLDKEEVEFRHTLGEIDDAAQADRLKEPERVLAESANEIASLDAQEALFRAALPNVDLAAQIAATPPPAAQPSPGAAGATSVTSSGTHPVPLSDLSAATPVDFAPDHDEVDATQVDAPVPLLAGQRSGSRQLRSGTNASPAEPVSTGSRRGVSGTRVTAKGPDLSSSADLVPAPPSGAKPGAPDLEDRTFIVPEASLLSEADDGKAVNFRLTALTYIGRSEENQLRLNDPGVSRRHVLITATQNGYALRDLGSQNGTYVNGDRVDEGPLADGDRITIGEVSLIFRSVQSAVRHA